ncbi:hypothetical protein FOMPIDRAFT_1047974 [Fomitopsis schrenkii]|uniref:Uncharacterized protein n=1 Tax=Fomitopsis schrenkii TaxID=2126942 RepID=S8EGF9_FOMSC|nr:hypothetical protein FOMPIDRAFT_1047974 [Fomitopsis schrenkii]
MEAHRRLFTEAENIPQIASGLTDEEMKRLDLDRCILVRRYIIYNCGKGELEGTEVRQFPRRPPEWPRVKVTDMSQLGSVSEVKNVDWPCHARCPHAGAPEAH